jgi:hypothetical protein
MCKFINQDPKASLDRRACSYPQFFARNAALLQSQNLPIDSDGFCLFHSKDSRWKSLEGFDAHFRELLKAMKEIHASEKEKLDTLYNFSGFFFPVSENPILLDNLHGKLFLDFSFSHFENVLTISNSNLNRLRLSNAHFRSPVTLSSVEIKNEPNFGKSNFEKGLKISNCQFDGHAEFDFSTYSNEPEVEKFALRIGKSRFIDPVYFSNSNFQSNVSLRDVTFDSDVSFDNCTFHDEAYFHAIKFEGEASFKFSDFLKTRNANPIFSVVSFQNVDLGQSGHLVFLGKKELYDAVRGEMQLELAKSSLGRVSFEDFNLNKLVPKSKVEMLKLQSSGKVTIGKGCLKYRHQSELKTVITSESNVALFEELARTFANYFTAKNAVMVGVEVVEKTKTSVQFFYFSDEDITREEFLERFQTTNSTFWNVGQNHHSKKGKDMTRSNFVDLDNFLDIVNFCGKYMGRSEAGAFTAQDLENIANLTSADDVPAIDSNKIDGAAKSIIFLFMKSFKRTKKIVNKGGLVITGGNTGNVDFKAKFGVSHKKIVKLLKQFHEKDATFQKQVKDEVNEIEKMEVGPERTSRTAGLTLLVMENGIPITAGLTVEKTLEYIKLFTED